MFVVNQLAVVHNATLGERVGGLEAEGVSGNLCCWVDAPAAVWRAYCEVVFVVCDWMTHRLNGCC